MARSRFRRTTPSSPGLGPISAIRRWRWRSRWRRWKTSSATARPPSGSATHDMPHMSLKQRINRLRREVTPPEDQSPIVVFVYGDPEPTRLLGRSLGGREAMIGSEVFLALDGESEGQFHRRLAKIARERVRADGGNDDLGRRR